MEYVGRTNLQRRSGQQSNPRVPSSPLENDLPFSQGAKLKSSSDLQRYVFILPFLPKRTSKLTYHYYKPSPPHPSTPSPSPYPPTVSSPDPCPPQPAASVSGGSATTSFLVRVHYHHNHVSLIPYRYQPQRSLQWQGEQPRLPILWACA